MSMLTRPRDDMCYCPGCSHGLLLERLAAALENTGLPRERICIVSDIGCIGTADQYFQCHTFHGLHGRSFTYAEGIKRARPELTVVVLVGDGGCGIGTAHLVHTARRNVGIKVLVCNNFNFGMTGGQHSPTTPARGRTTTTPAGAAERPFDICRTAMAAGAAFVARGSAHNDAATGLIEAALQRPGFALIDLWELCVAYYVPTNKLTPPGLVELSKRLDMPFGILQDRGAGAEDADEMAISATMLATLDDERGRADAPAAPRLVWPARTEICIAGSAGQRIRSAAGVLGEIAVAGGLFAAQQDDFPITVRKGHSISNLIISGEPILYSGLDRPEVLIVLSDDGLRRLGRLDALPPTCRVFADDMLTLPPTPADVQRLSLSAFSHAAGKPAAALAVLAHALAATGHVAADELLATARSVLGGAYRDANLRALEFGLSFSRPSDAPAAAASSHLARSRP
jgi:Pyruvate/2-oxoacid:ferredoxin oxidoreductase gamma subunit